MHLTSLAVGQNAIVGGSLTPVFTSDTDVGNCAVGGGAKKTSSTRIVLAFCQRRRLGERNEGSSDRARSHLLLDPSSPFGGTWFSAVTISLVEMSRLNNHWVLQMGWRMGMQTDATERERETDRLAHFSACE
jgi:hypothetical protein